MYKLFPRNLLTFLLLIKYKYTAAVSNPGTNSTPYSVKMFIDEYPQNTAMLPNTPNAISKIHKIIFFLIFSTSLYKYMHHKLYIKCTTIGGYNFFVYILNTASIMPAGNLYTKLLKKSPPVCSANPKIIALTITT